MAGGKRKKARVDSQKPQKAILGSLDAPLEIYEEKDDEERQLESLLFGTPFEPSTSRARSPNARGKDPERQRKIDLPSGFEHVVDDDLFMLDAPEDPIEIEDFDVDMQAKGDSDSSDDDGASSSSRFSSPQRKKDIAPSLLPRTASKKASAWSDPSDVNVKVSLANDPRLRKLRSSVNEDTVTGKAYETKLRQKYEQINPVPEWATNARNKLKQGPSKRRRASISSASDSDAGESERRHANLDDLLTSTDGLVARGHREARLPEGSISIERLRDANHAGAAEGSITDVKFHPSPSVPVMMTTSQDRRMRLFNIDGLTNPLLQTLHTADLAPTTALFHPSGSSIFLSGTRPFFYTYDLQSGRAIRSARGLWHGAANGARDTGESNSLEIANFSEDGDILAVAGRRGHVHFVDWKSGGSGGGGQIVGSLKMNSPVKDLCWVPTSSSGLGGVGGGRRLLTLGQDAEVYLWDVGSRRCLARWKDEGNFGAETLERSRNGSHYAVGSSTGIVNIYDSSASSIPTNSDGEFAGRSTLKSLKSLTNLTTAISSISFDNSGQVMAIASRTKKDQLRLVHLQSLTTFSNWPTSGTPLGTVTAVDFSVGSEYVAVGNTRGKVLLYHLRHFAGT